jgi:hypothetical protein
MALEDHEKRTDCFEHGDYCPPGAHTPVNTERWPYQYPEPIPISKRTECINCGDRILTMCQKGTGYCGRNCEKEAGVIT